MAGLGYGGYVLLNAHSEETDDAYVAGDIVQVTAREPGTVIAIHADNTQGVKAGQPLVDLDPRWPMRRSPRQKRLASAVRQVRSGFSRWSRRMPKSRRPKAPCHCQNDLARRGRR
jgi:membrane fusion protein (multidrug efflux system)